MSSFKFLEKNQNLRLVIILMAILVVGALTLNFAQQAANQPPPVPQVVKTTQPSTQAIPATAQQLIYGTWEQNGTTVHAVNTDGTGDTVIARLPLAVKNVQSLSPTQLLYIADTDSKDHGKRIVSFDIMSQTEQTVVSAEAGWGIDSLIVSPDKTWIAYWEVQLGSGGQLSGGQSRVYSASLASTPATKYLVFDEPAAAGSVVHYPLFFDHNNNLYSDGFSPNGGGWNYGLVRTTANGQNKSEVLAADSYSTDPMLSPNQNLVAYTAYDPSLNAPLGTSGSGQSRAAVLNPNTLVLLDLATNNVRQLLAEPGRLYFDPTWKTTGDAIFVRSYAVDGNRLVDQQPVTVDINTAVATQMDGSKIVDGLLISFTPDGIISGSALPGSNPGNLGPTYAPLLEAIAQSNGSTVTTIISNKNAQFISLVPGQIPLGAVNTGYVPTSDSLQLATFIVKPALATRPLQQNEPITVPTKDGRPQCKPLYEQLVGQGQTITETEIPTTFRPGDVNITGTSGREISLQLAQFGPATSVTTQVPVGKSYKEMKPQLRAQYKCYDSPLYLYPEETTDVTVKVTNANVLSTNLPYSIDAGWSVQADPDGTLESVNGTTADKIEYAYASTGQTPGTGIVVSRDELESKLASYGQSLGLAGRELNDYVEFWTGELPESPYYLVSHFVQPENIMNFEINPKPDSFIQAVMYFKPLAENQVKGYSKLPAPTFAPVPARHGFTAVDWSGIIDL